MSIELRAMPFDAKEIIDDMGQVTYDKTMVSKDYADWMSTFFTNGVLVTQKKALSTEMQVLSSGLFGLNILPGGVQINGRTGWLDIETAVFVDAGGSLPRIDRIVVELNIGTRNISIKVLNGVPAEIPQAPALIRTGDIFQVSLAQVRVEAGAGAIAEILDERPNNEVCGLANVKIGVRPPHGDSAENIAITNEVALRYSLKESQTTVEKALLTGFPLSSFMAWYSDDNENKMDAAFGKNIEEYISSIGFQLALFAWAKGSPKSNKFTNLMQCSSLMECIENEDAMIEVFSDEFIMNAFQSSPYAMEKISQFDWTRVFARMAGLDPQQFNTRESIWSSPESMSLFLENPKILDAIFAIPGEYNAIFSDTRPLSVLYDHAELIEGKLTDKIKGAIDQSPLKKTYKNGWYLGKCLFISSSNEKNGGGGETTLTGFEVSPNAIIASGAYANFPNVYRFASNLRSDAIELPKTMIYLEI